MIYRIVLDIELGEAEARRQAIGFDERREPRIEAGSRRIDGQQLAIAPQVLGTRANLIARDRSADGIVVVRDLERTEALVADIGRFRRKRREFRRGFGPL